LRHLQDQEAADLSPTAARLHDRPATILPEQMDASKRARVEVDTSPLSYEHHRGHVDWYELWGGEKG
jgi:hypothetical protein